MDATSEISAHLKVGTRVNTARIDYYLIYMYPEPRPQTLAQLSGLQVLLVEDEPDIAELFTFVLKEEGAEVIAVVNALDGLQALNQQFDVLICNICLPDMDGREFLQQIRSQHSQPISRIPAIAVSSYTREVSVQDVKRCGFDLFLSKPLDFDQLIGEILQLLG